MLQKIKHSLAYQNVMSAYKYSKLPRKRRNNNKINIVFLVERTSIWSSVESVYEAAKRNENINAYIIALQPCHNGEEDLEDNSVYEFCRDIDENAIKAYDPANGTYYDPEQLKPDYIFLNVPYSDEYPKPYKPEKLARIARLCYVPYGYILTKGRVPSTTITYALLSCASYIFAESKITYDLCRKKLFLSEMISGRRVYDPGCTRFDLYEDIKTRDIQDSLNVIWLPRWTTEKQAKNGNEPSSFFENKDAILDYANANPEDRIVIRPHPVAFDNYIASGFMTRDEINGYITRIESMKNVKLDNSPSYFEELIRADVLVADFTSIAAEFFIMERPIIYFGSDKNYPKEHKEMYNSFYHADTWADAESVLKALKRGEDPKREQRRLAVEHFRKGKEGNTGKRIIDILIKDMKKK